jgi:hypothetical protein
MEEEAGIGRGLPIKPRMDNVTRLLEEAEHQSGVPWRGEKTSCCKAREHGQNDVELLNSPGKCLIHKEEFAGAVEVYQHSLQKHPDQVLAKISPYPQKAQEIRIAEPVPG